MGVSFVQFLGGVRMVVEVRACRLPGTVFVLVMLNVASEGKWMSVRERGPSIVHNIPLFTHPAMVVRWKRSALVRKHLLSI